MKDIAKTNKAAWEEAFDVRVTGFGNDHAGRLQPGGDLVGDGVDLIGCERVVGQDGGPDLPLNEIRDGGVGGHCSDPLMVCLCAAASVRVVMSGALPAATGERLPRVPSPYRAGAASLRS